MKTNKQGSAYYVQVQRGEQVIASLTAFAKEHGLGAGSVVGIGAVTKVELGYYELPTRTYHRKTFSEEYELVNLTGNFSLVDGEPFVHAHVTIGDAEYRAHCGHLFEAEVAVTGEFVVTPLEGAVNREQDDSVGLKLWCMP
jgi:predicted DNA-binding protein with PD1-like motif